MNKTQWFHRALLGLAAAGTLAVTHAAEEGFRPLFNGKDLTGWDGNPKFWSVREGAITGQTTKENPTKGNTFLIWRDGTLEDFQLRFSYKVTPNNTTGFANSGVQYRSKEADKWVVGGYQADIEAGKQFSGILYEERGRGILAERGQRTVIDGAGKVNVAGSVGNSAEIQAAISKDGWNDYIIIAQGNHLTHVINGRVTVDVTDEQADKRASTGIVALQLHAGEPMTVQFKDIRVKRIKPADGKRIVLVAGNPSHGPGDHEHNAGMLLFKKCLQGVPNLQTTVYLNGFPRDPSAFDEADAIVVYSDGGGSHPLIQGKNLDVLRPLMAKGVGLGCIHYAVEVPKDNGGAELLSWTGGYFETHWSVNPHWEADFKTIPEHPVTRGVKPFKLMDEWYYHMRFPDDMKGVTPLLSAVPPDKTREGPDGTHSGNPEVRARKGMAEHVAWVTERPDGGRGFGFTGGHFHKEWANPNMRTLVLNAMLWLAKMDVPPLGVASEPSEADLVANLDPKGK